MKIDHGEVPAGAVFAGVDTHADTHWLCVLDGRGGVLLSEEFASDEAGCRALARAVAAAGAPVACGVEATATYGAGAVRALREAGVPCWEVLSPERARRRPGSRKSDPADAERAARQAAAGDGLSVPKDPDGWTASLRALLAARDRLVATATAAANAALGIARSAPGAVSSGVRGMGAARAMPAILGMAEPRDPAAAASLRALRALAESWRSSRESADALLADIRALVEENCPSLLAMHGCGPVSAARLAAAAGGDPARLRSEASFAALCGAAPVEASSGRTARHRLNRGGDRKANAALHQIALHRLRHDPRTAAYAERRRSEGLSEREVLRCLKRYVAREAYRALRHPHRVPDRPGEGAGLREARRAARVSQAAAAEALGVSRGLIGLMERGEGGSPAMVGRYARWIADGFPVPAD